MYLLLYYQRAIGALCIYFIIGECAYMWKQVLYTDSCVNDSLILNFTYLLLFVDTFLCAEIDEIGVLFTQSR